MLTHEAVRKMNEADLSPQVLVPMLHKMGFEDVMEWHGGALEQGKDIVCWKPDELGSRRNYALVVKAVELNGQANTRTGSAGEVLTQILQTFGSEFRDKASGDKQQVHVCWVVTNKSIRKEAQESITNSLRTLNHDRNVKFVDDESLWKLVQQYLPGQSVWDLLHSAQSVLDNIDPNYRPVVRSIDSGISLALEAKHPKSDVVNPIEMKMAFRFPDTVEGNAAADALTHMYTTGSAASIPGEYIEHVNVPDIIKQLIGDTSKPSEIQIESADAGKKQFVRVELLADDNQLYSVDSLPYRKYELTSRYVPALVCSPCFRPFSPEEHGE